MAATRLYTRVIYFYYSFDALKNFFFFLRNFMCQYCL